MPAQSSLPRTILALGLLIVSACGQDDGDTTKTIEFETNEVTASDVTVSPNSRWLVFSLVGHLFRVSVDGGPAEQLTFGPYFDSDPTYSPDGSQIAFVSDRDGSEGNIFVFDLETGTTKRITDNAMVARPAWSSDGGRVAYLSFDRSPDTPRQLSHTPSTVKEARLDGSGQDVVVSEPALYSSVFYLPDGRLAWSVLEGRPRRL